MKRLYLLLLSFVFISFSFAFEPSQSLKSKMIEINKKIGNIIQKDPTKLEKLEKSIEKLKTKYVKNERAIYILSQIENDVLLRYKYMSEGRIKIDSKYFKIEGGKIYVYYTMEEFWKEIVIGNFNENGKEILSSQEIDYNTFQELDYGFTKDKNGVYYCGSSGICKVINILDVQTFDILDEYYYKNKNNIYVFDINKIIEGEPVLLTGVDVDVFQVLGYGYAKDDKNLYYDGIIQNNNIDIQTFKLFNPYYYEDKNNVYIVSGSSADLFEFIPLTGADISTFQVFSGNYIKYAKDKNNVYIAGLLNKDLDPIGFELLTGSDELVYGYIIKDKDGVYSCGNVFQFKGCTMFTGIDSATVQLVSKTLLKDKNGIYSLIRAGDKIDNDLIDIETFEELNYYYHKDKNNIYILEDSKEFRLLTGADVATFKIFGTDIRNYGYAKDKNHVYIYSRKNNDLDPLSFELLPLENSSLDGHVIRDKNGIYIIDINGFFGEGNYVQPLKNIDKDTFQKINYYHYKDKNHVYYGDCGGLEDYKETFFVITGADVNSFEVFLGKSGNHHGKDKNHIYWTSKIITGADINSFELLHSNFTKDNNSLSKDKNGVYIGTKKVEGVDMLTFQYEPYTDSFEDKNYTYYISFDFGKIDDENYVVEKKAK